MSDALIDVGLVSKVYGLKGYVKIIPYIKETKILLHSSYWLLEHSGKLILVSDVKAKYYNGNVLATWLGCNNRDIAITFCGAHIKIKRSDFPPLCKGEYYWIDLIGLQVINLEKQLLGLVSNLIDNSAHSILIVKNNFENKKTLSIFEYLIPFVKNYIIEIDLINKYIIVDWQFNY